MGVWDDIAAVGERAWDGVEHGVKEVADTIFGRSGAANTSPALADLRWAGMSNGQLADAIEALHQGPGAAALTNAADALANIAAALARIDQTLHDQLSAIGVDWQSQAGDLAQEMLGAAAAYGGTVTDQGGQTADAMNRQADAYNTAKNGVPDASALRGPSQNSALNNAAGSLTGHATDHAQRVALTNAARQQAIDALTNYTVTSQANLCADPGSAPPPALSGGSAVVGAGSGAAAPGPGAVAGPPIGGGSAGPLVAPPGGPLASGPVSGVGPPLAPPAPAPVPATPPPALPAPVRPPVTAAVGPATPAVVVAPGSVVDEAVAGAAIAAGSVAAGAVGAEAVSDRFGRGRRDSEPAGILDEEYEEDDPVAAARRDSGDYDHRDRYGAGADFFGVDHVPPSVFGDDDQDSSPR